MTNRPNRRVEKLASIISYALASQSLDEILQETGSKADDASLDAALLHAFTLSRSRAEMHKRGIAREEIVMERIRDLMRQPSYQTEAR